ncbi:MAG: hypothetical protein HN736_01895 [Anaerolineae bacterium]|jgi:hypothetical protein|nr:hypothetical protein [Anaerolineae bacterium]MBT3713006.1 hypothetical protein [Anaerolineae bacterium]MBT4309462.1 hypothetical protein [Anaerolineae bacterium]MBT4458262.1 hypothetical protein [Anaerolineae bacterium]MBT4840983.1 hypothetical protein [Anaerolineae bacterium]
MDAKAKKTLLIGLAGILWLLAVMLGYAYTHKPFSPEQVFVLGKAFWQLFIGVGIISLMGALGERFFPIIKKEFSPLEAIAIQSALGMGVLGIFVLVLGMSIGFSSIIFGVLFLILAIFLRKDLLLWWRSWGAFTPIWRKSTVFEKILASGVLFILIVTLAKSLVPPLAFDSLVYHLTLPKIYLLDGSINYVPELIFWGMPQIQEMGQTFAMALGGTESATVFSWTLGALTLTGLLGFLSEKFSTRTAWVALATLLSGFSLSDSLSWGYVGWATMLYGLSFFLLLDLWRSRGENKLLWISALILGFAMGTKYTTAILAGGALVIIFSANNGRGIKPTLRNIFIFGGITFLTFSPWLIKNWLATGNPFYPLLFPSGAMDANRLLLYQDDPVWGDWRDALFLPWQATIWGVEKKSGYSAEFGALFLALSPLVWVGWRERSNEQRKSLSVALIITITGFIIWAIAGRTTRLLIQTRLYYAFFPAWAILAGVGFDGFSKLRAVEIRFGRIASALVILAFGFNVFVTGLNFTQLRVAGALLGAQTHAHYRERALGTYESAISALVELPPDSQVLMLWETRGLACIPKCKPDETIDRWYADLRNYGSSDAVLDAWQSAGNTHVLFYKRGADFVRENDSAYNDTDWSVLEMLLEELIFLEDFGVDYQLFSLQ